MITVGDKFPAFELLACAELPADQLNMDNAFKTVTENTYKGKSTVDCIIYPPFVGYSRLLYYYTINAVLFQ